MHSADGNECINCIREKLPYNTHVDVLCGYLVIYLFLVRFVGELCSLFQPARLLVAWL